MTPTTKRLIRRVVFAGLALTVTAAGVTLYLIRRPPQVWRTYQDYFSSTTEAEREQAADAVRDRLEQAVTTAVQSKSPADLNAPADEGMPVDVTVRLTLTNQELAAMASDNFNNWTAQRGYEVPSAISQPVVAAEGDRLAMAFEVSEGGWSQVFSGYIALRFRPDGMAEGSVERLTAGSLPVSVTSVGDALRDGLPQAEADYIGNWIAQMQFFEFRPVLELESRRRARVIDMKVGKEGVVVTLRVQDHETYKLHNAMMDSGTLAVTDAVRPNLPAGQAIADVPTTTD